MDKVIFALATFAFGYFVALHDCKAQELYTIATVKSYHQDRSAGYNEKNMGIGLELHLNSDWKTIVGEYKNSFTHKSIYYGVAWMPFHRGDVSAGLLAVNVSGYLQPLSKYAFGAIPIVEWKLQQVLLNVVFIPPIRNEGLIACQIGWRFY